MRKRTVANWRVLGFALVLLVSVPFAMAGIQKALAWEYGNYSYCDPQYFADYRFNPSLANLKYRSGSSPEQN